MEQSFTPNANPLSVDTANEIAKFWRKRRGKAFDVHQNHPIKFNLCIEKCEIEALADLGEKSLCAGRSGQI